MRLNDLRKGFEKDPDALYATCDWQMVKLVSPISDQWRYKYGTGKNKGAYVLPEETDPWAKCGDTRTRVRPSQVGVLVEQFAYDKDGNQGESMGQTLVKSKDIGGPWGEFLVLHADEVRLRGEKHEAGELAKSGSIALGERIDAITFDWPVGEVKVKRADDRDWERDSYLSSKVRTDYSQVHTISDRTIKDRRQVKVKPDSIGTLPYWHPRLEIEANNDADVEYLLQVLEEGTKALAKKAARRTAKANKG